MAAERQRNGGKLKFFWLWIFTYLADFAHIESKIYDRCELARELYEKHQFPLMEIPTWLCIVNWESGYNTRVINKGRFPNSLDYGIFQISDSKWCKSSLRRSQNRCGIPCENLADDNLSDDVGCLKIISNQTGLNEWMSYGLRCTENTQEYFKNCDIISRAINMGMKLNLEPQPHVRLNIKPIKDSPLFMKIRLGLTKNPKGLRANVNVKETRLNFFTKYLGAYYRMKPFFSMHQYVTR